MCILQVFPHVLHVCELGLCSSDAAENSKLEASFQVLPLVSCREKQEVDVYILNQACVSLSLSLCFYLSLQDSVFPGDELVSHSHVPLLLVLRHCRHGDCWLYLQVYRVCRVSGVERFTAAFFVCVSSFHQVLYRVWTPN